MDDRVKKSGCFIGGPVIAEHLLAGLPKHALEAFTLLRRRELFPEGASIVSRGTAVKNICILCSGAAVIRVPAESGTSVVREVVPHELLGITEAFSKARFEYDVQTTLPCFIDSIDIDDFLEFVASEPSVCLRLLEDLGSNLQRNYLDFAEALSDD